MTLDKLLADFYLENDIPPNGGKDDDTFQVKFLFFSLKLPNPSYRKKVTYIHDLEHVLNNCDTSWKGEAFIAGWEIATGFWKHFPISIFIFWAMGFSLWIYPKSVFLGFKKGLTNKGIIDLNLDKNVLMKMELEELVMITKKKRTTTITALNWVLFICWSLISQFIFLAPFILFVLLVLFYL